MSLTKDKAMSAGEAGKRSEGGLYETVKVVVQALLLALVVRTFLFQPFNIPSGSMKSTLLVGDYIFVSKFAYGYSRYSFPFGPPLFSGRVWASQPKRGDVVVFKLPTDNETDYIKRVIGLPGDRIQMIGGVLHINGQAVKRERVQDFVETEADGSAMRVARYRETLPNGVKYDTLDLVENGIAETHRRPQHALAPMPVHHGRGRLEARVQEHSADQGLDHVRQDRGLAPAARQRLALAHADVAADVERLGDLGAGLAPHQQIEPRRQLPFVRLRKGLDEHMRHREPEDAVAEEFEPFVGRVPAARDARMRQGALEKRRIAEFVAEPAGERLRVAAAPCLHAQPTWWKSRFQRMVQGQRHTS